MMNITEKLEYLQNKHLGDWLKTRAKVETEFSNKQSMFCICGKLATGLHESNCRKFIDAVTKETVKRLSHLMKQSEVKP